MLVGSYHMPRPAMGCFQQFYSLHLDHAIFETVQLLANQLMIKTITAEGRITDNFGSERSGMMRLWRSQSKPGIQLTKIPSGLNWGRIARVLFWFNLLASGALILLLLLTPWFIKKDPRLRGWLQILVLFGHDAVVRRVSLASSIGLIVIASICFWPSRGQGKRPLRTNRRPTQPMVGA